MYTSSLQRMKITVSSKMMMMKAGSRNVDFCWRWFVLAMPKTDEEWKYPECL